MGELLDCLEEFATHNGVSRKGALSLVLVLTRRAQQNTPPFDPASFVTDNKGQVSGLSQNAVQSILEEHGIIQVLSREGGRTSRGSLGRMQNYLALLNELDKKDLLDFAAIEEFWVQKVRAFFSRSGFVLRYDSARTLSSAIIDLIEQAEALQHEEDGGTMYVGALLHYMVGAKLRLSLDPKLKVRSASSSDESSKTGGDYDIGDAVIHVTSQPSEPLFEKCTRNLSAGQRPVVVTIPGRIEVARQWASMKAIVDRVEIVDATQFMAMNLYEKGLFEAANEKPSLEVFVNLYNAIVDDVDSDPSLRIKFA